MKMYKMMANIWVCTIVALLHVQIKSVVQNATASEIREMWIEAILLAFFIETNTDRTTYKAPLN